MATKVAATLSGAASKAKSEISVSEERKKWDYVDNVSKETSTLVLMIGKYLGDEPLPSIEMIVSDDASELSSESEEEEDKEEKEPSTFALMVEKYIGDEPVPAIKMILSDDASELSSESEEEEEKKEKEEKVEPVPAIKIILSDVASKLSTESEKDKDKEEKKGEEGRHRPHMARGNVKCSELSPHPEAKPCDKIFASRPVDEGYTYLVVADGEHANKHVTWTCDSSDSDTSVNTKKTSNTNASTRRDDVSYKSTGSPFFGYDTPKEFKPPIKSALPLGRQIKFALPPGRVMMSQSSRHGQDDSSIESEDFDEEPFFDEVEPNRSDFDKLLDTVIDGLLPHHGLDTVFYDYGSEDYVSSDFEEDSSQEYNERESLFQDDDEESADEESLDDNLIEEAREGQKDYTSRVATLLGNEPLPDIRPIPFSVTIPDDDQGTRGLYANVMTRAVSLQGRAARGPY